MPTASRRPASPRNRLSNRPGGDDRYFSAVEWLLHDWEYLMRRIMTQIKDVVEKLDVEMPADDVRAHIAGPAIVVDAIALD